LQIAAAQVDGSLSVAAPQPRSHMYVPAIGQLPVQSAQGIEAWPWRVATPFSQVT
jgi:hypothetical protein